MNLSAESVASVRLELMYDQSGEAVAVVPAWSPRPLRPPRPAGSPMLVTTEKSLETDPHQ